MASLNRIRNLVLFYIYIGLYLFDGCFVVDVSMKFLRICLCLYLVLLTNWLIIRRHNV